MQLTSKQKKFLGIGAGALVALTTLALIFRSKPKKKKDYGLRVDGQCNTYEVTNENKVRDNLRAGIRAQKDADPFQVTKSFLNKAAPNCTTYPSNVRNPGEAVLFIKTFNSTLDIMEDENLLSEEQIATFKSMVKIWGVNQGVPIGDF
jgi:hypothetical protein